MDLIENQLLLTFGLLIVTVIIKLVSRKSVNRFLNRFDFDTKRKRIVHRIINLFLFIFVAVSLISIWNIDQKDLIVFLTSVVTVLGIAFFAQWSILSNITSSLILFFNHPLKIGQNIRVLDKEYDVEGKLIDISFFFMYIRNEEGYLITIPTSVALQKTMVTKDEEKKKLHKVVRKVTCKNQNLIPKFKEKHPDCNTYHSKFSDQYNKIIIESMGGSGDNDYEKEEKIIKNISKQVFIDK